MQPHQERKRRISNLFGDEPVDAVALETILDSVDASVWAVRRDGQVCYGNRRWWDYSGLRPGSGGHAEWLRLVHPDERAVAQAQWEAALRGGEAAEARYRLRRARDRVYHWHLCRVLPVTGTAGGCAGWVTVATDVDALMTLTVDMREELAARDAGEEEHAELLAEHRVTRVRAEMNSRAKDEFLALLGHELRNPLAPIVVALQLLRMRGAADQVRELSIIERQVQHLVRLVDDLLDVSRITKGTIRLRKERIEVAAVVSKAVEMASPLLEQREQHLIVDVPATDCPLDADCERLAQVVANLLTNAAKYTPPRGHIHVTATREPGTATVAIRVRDDGRGMAPELLAAVFDMFVQDIRPIDRSEGGLGLGLTLVRTLVELHGGTVTAHSAGPGLGSEFVVHLPLAGVVPAVASEPPSAPIVISGRRVLVVDDNTDVVEVMAELLRLSGYEVVVALDAAEALRVAGPFAPEVAILDIGLPVMDGYELARRLRLENPALRLVAVTGYGQAEDRDRSQAAGFQEHLVKPIDPDELLATLAAKTQ